MSLPKPVQKDLAPNKQDRLYKEVAQHLFDDLADGRYVVGDRLPAERDLAIRYDVSRPTVREAIIALEVQGFVEVRVGSGAHVLRIPGMEEKPGFNVTAFELTEARLLIEGEVAALAAKHISDEELDRLEQLVRLIASENRQEHGGEAADREFHLTIAAATRNAAMVKAIEDLWQLRATSPDSALLHAKARHANVKPVVQEHTAIIDALRTCEPAHARAAMRAHLSAVLDYLLFATEEAALERARKSAASTRERYADVRAI